MTHSRRLAWAVLARRDDARAARLRRRRCRRRAAAHLAAAAARPRRCLAAATAADAARRARLGVLRVLGDAVASRRATPPPKRALAAHRRRRRRRCRRRCSRARPSRAGAVPRRRRMRPRLLRALPARLRAIRCGSFVAAPAERRRRRAVPWRRLPHAGRLGRAMPRHAAARAAGAAAAKASRRSCPCRAALPPGAASRACFALRRRMPHRDHAPCRGCDAVCAGCRALRRAADRATMRRKHLECKRMKQHVQSTPHRAYHTSH